MNTTSNKKSGHRKGNASGGTKRSFGAPSNGSSDRSQSRNGNSRFEGNSGGFKNKPGKSRFGKSKKNKGSDIELHQLVNRAKPIAEATPYMPTRTFEQFPINGKLKNALKFKGYTTPTEIQDRSIDEAINGKDMIGIAQTGTGKTAAFLIPVLERYLQTRSSFSTLVIVPTRELAVQVLDEFQSLTKKTNLQALKVIGGTSLFHDIRGLRRNPDIVIGTPGRLVDLVQRGELPLEAFNVLIIDEFDRMLDMGFSKDVMSLANGMRNREQTMLFSATVDKSIKSFVDQLVKDPIVVQVTSGTSSADNIEQDVVYPIHGEDRFDTLVNLLNDPEFERVILFAETRHKVHRLAGRLNKVNIAAEAIHGDKTQSARQQALNKFKNGKSRILVATDVAARGIDVNDVTHVINYEVPRTYDSYIHRIGRTGRAGKAGIALTFVD